MFNPQYTMKKTMKAAVDRFGQWGLAPWKSALLGSSQIKNISITEKKYTYLYG